MINILSPKQNIKQDSNIDLLKAYQDNSASNFSFSGTILDKNGKKIRMQTSDKSIYDITTKINLDVSSGQTLQIKKSQIETIVKISDDQIKAQKEHKEELEKKLEEMDVEKSKENLEGAEALKKYDVPLTKENLLKFVTLKNSINDVKSELNMDILAKLLADNSISNLSIFDLSKKMKNETIEFHARVSEKDSAKKYDDARKIANDIYNSKMGKDVYDIIIALKNNGVEITRENIDSMYDSFSKLNDIKGIDDKNVIEAMNSGTNTISIDLLYKVKNFISSSKLDAVTIPENSNLSKLSISKTPTDDEIETLTPQIEKLLKELGFDKKDIDTAKLLIKNSMDVSKENLDMVYDIQATISEIAEKLDKNIAAILIGQDMDMSSMDLKQLLAQINAIMQNLNASENLDFSQDELDSAGILIDAIKQIQQDNSLITNYKVKSVLSSKLIGQDLYDKLFGSHYSTKVLDYKSAVITKSALVLSSVDKIDFDQINPLNSKISLHSLSRLVNTSFKMNELQNEDTYKQLEYDFQYQEISFAKKDIQNHYDYLKQNMRASHIRLMMQDGVDPYNSDIRVVSEIVSTQNQIFRQTERIIGNNVDTYSENESISRLVVSNSEFTFSNFKKSMEISTNTSSYFDKLSELEKLNPDSFTQNIITRLKKVIEKFNVNDPHEFRHELQNNILAINNEIKNIQKSLETSDSPNKPQINEYLKNLTDEIRQTRMLTKQDEMLQIPFYMNGDQSNANVYAKTKKNAKGKIDPDDMSVLIDLNTKNLGKVGFYIKANGKKLSLKISAENTSISKLRQSINMLDTSLSDGGYELNLVDLISPDNKAKLAFIEENVKESNTMIDFTI